MNKKTKIVSIFLSILIVGFIFEIVYLQSTYGVTENQKQLKNTYVSVVQLPDLAISTESMYVRHRSLSTVFEIFKDDPTIYTYFPSTFVISHSTLQTNISKVEVD